MDKEEAGRQPEKRAGLSVSWWQQRPAHLLLLAGLLPNLALFLYLALVRADLPAEVPLSFDRSGSVDRTGAAAALVVLPLAGLLAWLLNSGLGWVFYHHRREPPVALILWGGSIVIQFCAWIALWQLTTTL